MKSNPALQFTGIFTRVFACLILVTAALALDVNHDGMDDLWQARYNIAPFAGALDPDGDGRINLVEAINMSDPVSTALPDAGLGSVYIRDLDPVDGLDDHWQARFGITAAQALEDPDEDGRTNLEESIVASDPFVADQPWSGAGQNPGGGAAGGPQEWVLTIPVTVPGWRYTLQSSDTLMQNEWSTAAVASGQNAVHWGGGGPLSITAATGGAERKFFRWFIDSPDTDGDGLGDWAEMQLGTGVMSIDTDGDGFSDSVEWGGGFHPVSAAHSPESVLSNGGIWLEHAAADTWDHVRWNKQAGPPVKYQTVADYGPDGDYDSSPWTESVPVMPAPQGLLPPEALSFGAWSAQWNQGGDFYEQPLYSYQVEQDMSPVPGAGSPYGGGRNSGARHAKFRLVTDYPRVHATTRVVMVLPEKWDAQYSPGLWQGTYAGPETPQYHTLQLPAGATTGPAVAVQLAVQTGVARQATAQLGPQVEVLQPEVTSEGTAGPLHTVGELRMCRWNSPRPNNHQVDRASFASADPDRIVIRLPVPSKKGSASVKVKISTRTGTHTPDVGAELDFMAESSSSEYFVSDPLAIVTDEEDDELQVGTGEDNELGDRTFRARPGGRLHIECSDLGSQPIEIPIKRFTHKVRYQNVFVGMDAAEVTAAQNCVNENKLRLWQIYAREHVEVVEEATSQTITDNDFRTALNVGLFVGLNDDQLGKIPALLTAPSNVIKVVWVSKTYNRLLDPGAGGTNLGPIGHPSVCLMWLMNLNANTAAAQKFSQSVAHEVGHSLGLANTWNHLQISGAPYEPYMLMCRGQPEGGIPGSNFIIPDAPDRSAKHLLIKDDSIIKSSALCAPQSP